METSLIKLEPILAQIQTDVPKMIRGRDNAVAAMKAVTVIENDDDLDAVNSLLVGVRNTEEAIYNLRKPITDPLDELKKQLMVYEKDLAADGPTEVKRLRQLIGSYNQAKLDTKKKAEAEAARIKEKENHKVDVVARIKKNLSDMVVNRAREVQDGCKKFWDSVTLENFDEKEKIFMSQKPVLKTDMYNRCFEVSSNPDLLTKKEFEDLIAEVGAQETYIAWNEAVMEITIPIVNDWRGRMTDIKQNLVNLKNAGDEEARHKLAQEQKRKAEEEDKLRQDQLLQLQKDSDENIQREAQVDKIQNEFREQAVTQQLESTGPVKLLLRFKDDKPLKALNTILYHCFMNEKFPSIIKKDKSGMAKFDEHGFPIYIDSVDYFVQFFLKYCDVNVEGIELKEISKVIVRK